MLFIEQIYKNNKKSYLHIYDDFVFEIREVASKAEATKNAEFQSLIDEIDGYLDALNELDNIKWVSV